MSQISTDVGKNESDLKMQTYDRDFYQWTVEQAQALRSRDDSSLDWNNLTES